MKLQLPGGEVLWPKDGGRSYAMPAIAKWFRENQ